MNEIRPLQAKLFKNWQYINTLHPQVFSKKEKNTENHMNPKFM